jgi:thiamine biosynthesis lipoprotein ApbE
VSVIARNGAEADWLSTAASVLDPAKGLRLVKKVPKASAYILEPAATGFRHFSSL